MITDYASLQTTVAAWMNRGDVAALVPDFIALGEARIEKKLRIRQMLVTETFVTAANGTIPLPDGFLEFKSLTVNGKPLDFLTPEQLAEKWLTWSSLPVSYSVDGDSLVFGPAPDGVYSVAARYYKRIDPLATTPTNAVLTMAPDLYLRAALIEGYIYVKNTKEVQEQGLLFQAALDDLHLADARAMHAGSSLRVRAR